MADVVIVDCSTGEQTRRPLTAEEEAQRQRDAEAMATLAAAEAAREQQRQADLAALRAKAASDATIAALLRVLNLA